MQRIEVQRIAVQDGTAATPAVGPDVPGADAGAGAGLAAAAWSASSLDAGSAAGYAIAATDGFVFIGAPADESAGREAGSVHVLAVPGAGGATLEPTLVQTLVPPDPAESDRFGWSVAVDGDLLVVGSGQQITRGRVWIYQRDAQGVWTLSVDVDATNALDQLGYDVDVLSGADSIVVVGEPGADASDGSAGDAAGVVRVYTESMSSPGTWNEASVPLPAGLGAGDRLGTSVAAGRVGDDVVLVAGAPLLDATRTDQGAAWVWLRDDSADAVAWLAPIELATGSATNNGHFGHAVGVHRAGVFVSSPDASNGRVEFFALDAAAGTSTLVQTITAPPGFASLRFGSDVAIDGDRLVVGAMSVHDRPGAAFVYMYDGVKWAHEATLEGDASLAGTGDVASDFGRSVAVHGADVWVGAPSLHEAALTNPEPVRVPYRLMDQQRVETVIFGDSNANFGGDGWAMGLPDAFRNRDELECFGTGVFGANINNGNGANLGDLERDINGGGPLGEITGAPEALNRFMPAGEDLYALHVGSWLDDGEAETDGVNNGFFMDALHPMDISGPLRARYQYAAFRPTGNETSAHSFRPLIRRGSSPFSQLVSEPVSTLDPALTEAFELREGVLLLEAQPRNFPLNFRYNTPGQGVAGGVNGRSFLTWGRVTNDARDAGWAVSTRSWEGGQSLRVFVDKYRAYDGVAHENYFEFLRRDASSLGQTPRLVAFYSSGLNDRNDPLPSVGGSPAPTSTFEGFVDNALAFNDELRGTWADAGWDQSELGVLLAASHPVNIDAGRTSDRRLVEYHRAVRELAETTPGLTGFDWSWLIDAVYLDGQGLYDTAGPAHFEPEGYRRMAGMLVNALLAADGPERGGAVVRFVLGETTPCIADWNGNGAINITDVVGFLQAFEMGAASTNLVDDGALNILDVVEYITLWNAGCP